MSVQKLVFVYNADSGKLRAMLDLLHKKLSPATYPCRLCALTWGNTDMYPQWKEFIAAISLPVVFMHKDEFIEANGNAICELPALFAEDLGKLQILIGGKEMQKIEDLDQLMHLVRARVDALY